MSTAYALTCGRGPTPRIRESPRRTMERGWPRAAPALCAGSRRLRVPAEDAAGAPDSTRGSWSAGGGR
eukprot:6143802-Prymnesium_polylepis.1